MKNMIEVVVKTCLNLTKNVYIKFDVQGSRYEIDSERGQFLEFPKGAKMVYFEGNYTKSDFLDKVESLVDDLKFSNNYKVIIDGKDVTEDF